MDEEGTDFTARHWLCVSMAGALALLVGIAFPDIDPLVAALGLGGLLGGLYGVAWRLLEGR